jgi:drug/metabolite transporter (DMT)-like permease
VTDLALVLTTFIWGTTFIVVKGVLADVAPLHFVALRFTIAALALWIVALATRARFDRATWRAGAIAAVPFYLSFLTQTLGLVWASPATSAFITGFSVVLVPLFSVAILRRRIGAWSWAGAVCALVGLGFLTLHGASLKVGPGEAWTFGTAIAVAAHILVLERVSPGKSPLVLTAVQLLFASGLAWACRPLDPLLVGPGVVTSAGPLALTPHTWGTALYMGLAATAFAFLAQTWAQAHMPATRVGVLFTLEPVFALICSLVVGAERIAPRAGLGMALILCGMVLVETLGRRVPAALGVGVGRGGNGSV